VAEAVDAAEGARSLQPWRSHLQLALVEEQAGTGRARTYIDALERDRSDWRSGRCGAHPDQGWFHKRRAPQPGAKSLNSKSELFALRAKARERSAR
jgi:hypothetical protein